MNYKEILAFARQLRKNQTPAEDYFWQQVRNRNLFGKKFNRQYIIQYNKIQYSATATSNKFFIADFYCHDHKLIIELDGAIHQQQVEYDQIREEILLDLGYTVIRFSNDEVLENWEKVKAQLEAVLR